MTGVAKKTDLGDNDIAIVGMAAHLRRAATVAQYCASLAAGVESIRNLTEAELLANGETPAGMRHRDPWPPSPPIP